MSVTPSAVVLFAILVATQVAVTEWLTRNVLELPSKRPLLSAIATAALASLVVGPAIAAIDALLGGSVSSFTRTLVAGVVAVVQTGLVLRLIYRTSLPLALGHGLVLNLTWAATGLLLMLGVEFGGFYAATPLVLFVAGYAIKRFQDRQLTRLFDSIPPAAPFHASDTQQA
jgi:hypothetical protein